jgi:hypothetical protein
MRSMGGGGSLKRHCFSWTFFRLDPARSDLDLGAQFSYHIPRPDPPTRPHTGEWRRAVLGALHIGSLGKVHCAFNNVSRRK